MAKHYGIPGAITEWAGNSGEHTALYDVTLRAQQACACAWRDHKNTKTVLTLSSFFRAEEATRVMRWDSEVGERIERDAPEVIASYNRHMGYVDLHSQIAQGTMTCRQRTTRWVQAAFQDMLDSQLANAFIIAKREMTRSGVAAVDHREFLCVLAHIFCDVPASTPAARRELDVALRKTYGLYGDDGPEDEGLIDVDGEGTVSENGDARRHLRQGRTTGQPLFKRINDPTRLIGISEGITKGQGANEQHVHWPIPLPPSRKVNGVVYPKHCVLCKSDPQGIEGRIKVACTVCRLSACYKHYYQIHGVNLRTGPDEDETTESDQFWESFRSDLRKRFKRSEEEGSEEVVDEENSE